MSHPQTNSVHDLMELCKKRFSNLSHPYTPLDPQSYTIQWNSRMRSRAGVCKPKFSLIELNPHLLKNNDDLEQTLVHELCHLVICRNFPYASPHGRSWQRLMKHLGFEPKRCHNLGGSIVHHQKKWDAGCQCRQHKITTRLLNKIRRGQRYRCLQCKSILVEITPESAL